MHIKPEGFLLELLTRRGLSEYFDGFDIPADEFESHLKKMASGHPDKTDQERRDLAAYATLLHPNSSSALAPAAKKMAEHPDLSKATKQVRGQIEALASTIADGQGRVAAAQADAITALGKSLRGVDVGADLNAAAKKIVGQIESIAGAIGTDQKAIADAYSDGSTAIARSCAGFASGLSKTAQSAMLEIDRSAEELAGSIEGLAKKLNAFSDSVSRIKLSPESAAVPSKPKRSAFDWVMLAVLILILLVLCGKAKAQTAPANPIIPTTTNPNGQACGNTNIKLLTPGGTLYTCQGGTYAAVSGGGGGTPGGSNGQIQYNNSGSFGGTSAVPICASYQINYNNSTLSGSATTTAAVTLFTLPASAKVTAINIKHSTAFAGTSVTATTVSAGDGAGNPNSYSQTYDIFQPATSSGTVNVSGTAVTWASGSAFNYQASGPSVGWSTITINGVDYPVQSMSSTTALTLGVSAGTQSGVAYSVTPQYDDGGAFSAKPTSHAITANFTSVGGNLNALTAGSVTINACYYTIPAATVIP